MGKSAICERGPHFYASKTREHPHRRQYDAPVARTTRSHFQADVSRLYKHQITSGPLPVSQVVRHRSHKPVIRQFESDTGDRVCRTHGAMVAHESHKLEIRRVRIPRVQSRELGQPAGRLRRKQDIVSVQVRGSRLWSSVEKPGFSLWSGFESQGQSLLALGPGVGPRFLTPKSIVRVDECQP